MTICIATDGFPPQVGGIATFNKHLVSLLTDAGHKVIVLYMAYDSEENDQIITEGLLTKVILRKTYQQHYKQWQGYFRPGGYDAANWIAIGMAMRQWLLSNNNQFNIDVIEASDYGGCGIFLCDASLPPVIITGHGSLVQLSRYNYSNNDDSYRVVCKLEELSFIQADAVIAHSQVNKLDLEKLFKRHIESATIPWINKDTGDNNPADKNKLLVIGGLQPAKGVYTMAEAMQLLSIKQPGVVLEWIGGDTWLAPGQQKVSLYLEKKYPSVWQQNFIWKNEQPHGTTQNDLLSASLVIIPSAFETFSYVALEAAACKKAIVITDKTGASGLFTHGKDAWIVPADDPAALAEAILHLISNPELCKQLGENAYQMVQHELTKEKIISERMAVYSRAIQSQKQKEKGLHPGLSFLNNYRTPARKYYYCIRRFLKKLTGKS
ncbi:MAG TPA: glycosyltransferase family 4 protein [Chitinophagaceae bacterium]|nr:glycosyltransferase family 4 protein [Chitinophagaceae bacterium]